jgi:glucose-1-phosphate cytidylyltransferase
MLDVLILCGGKGTRSYPFTEYYPKAMMPIAGSPIIVHLMRIYASQGFTRFVLAGGHRYEVLADYLEGRYREWDIDVVNTGEDADTGERVRRGLPHVGRRFLATYGDGLGNVDVHASIASHEASRALGTVTAAPLRSQYGTIEFDDRGRIRQFREKPLIRNCWINAGFFVFERELIEKSDGQNLERDILPAVAAEGRLNSYRHEGFWKSMDTSKDQQEMEALYAEAGDVAPWMNFDHACMAVGAGAAGSGFRG